MNRKQIDEFRVQKAKQKADENAFALEMNKGAEAADKAKK